MLGNFSSFAQISLEEFYWLLRFSGCISQGKLSIEPHFPGHENKTGSIQSVLDVHNGNLFSEVNTNKMMSQWKWNALGAWMFPFKNQFIQPKRTAKCTNVSEMNCSGMSLYAIRGLMRCFSRCWFTHNLHTFKSLKPAYLKTLSLEQLHCKM